MTGSDYKLPCLDSVQQRALRIVKGTATFKDRFVPEHETLVKLISTLRSMGCVIGFTTGVWDLFHLGHPEYIQRGKDETVKCYPDADHVIMVVGVDTDEMTRLRKGPGRPIVPQDERVRVLSHVRAVDLITLQYEPDQLFKVVEHDVRVVSTSTKDLPMLDLIQSRCAHVVNLPPQAETSTTARVRQLMLEGRTGMFKSVKEKFLEMLNEMERNLEN
ncbi:adenylyltransferase/cytidyltransferase family protein [Candidatus Kaiserbacteria bacterium]|nr:adenylyltransferase/cytidyltransferase family protein [Candidatus Kaiserbacteria bacterium]